MPRPLALASDQLALLIDRRYRVKELFTLPNDGHNHIVDQAIRLGVFADEKLSWCDYDEWLIDFKFDPAGVGRTTLHCANLGLVIQAEDSIQGNTWSRKLEVRNLRPESRTVRLFQTQRLNIAESDIGNTACWRPDLGQVVHYKGGYFFGFGARTVRSFTTGIAGFAAMEGTWRDAEDGVLSENPIAQGSVDSTLCVELTIPGSHAVETEFFMLAGRSFADLKSRGPGLTFSGEGTVEQRWEALMLTHARGPIIASLDSEIMETNRANYAYGWMRDGALVASLLAKRGRLNEAGKFFEWMARCEGPPYLQKYDAAGNLGASWHPWIRRGRFQIPTQPDETALPLIALRDFQKASGDLGSWRDRYAELAQYLMDHRDPATGLPNPGYDLWEERFGTHTYTVGTVIAGLEAANELALAFDDNPAPFRKAASDIRMAMEQRLRNHRTGTFARGLDEEGNLDERPDASLLLLAILGVVAVDDSTFEKTADWLERDLWVQSPVGGMARYPGDYYFRRSEAYPGNPWVITTMWLAQVRAMQGQRARAESLLNWAEERSERTGVLAEQYHPDTGEPLSVSPLTWSHAEVLATLDALRVE